MALVVLGRTLRVKYLVADKRFVDADRMLLETNLRRLTDVTLSEIKSIDDPDFLPCDLLIVAAKNVAAIDFGKWLEGFRKRIHNQGNIWIPALILTQVEFEDLRDILLDAVNDNWYFDVINADHISSLPIRVANLLKIHDHLHEMDRYERSLSDLGDKIAKLEAQLTVQKDREK
jgi:hypothetical protein